MIVRAAFWIGLVAISMPHVPDGSLGKPAGDATSISSAFGDWANTQSPPAAGKRQSSCPGRERPCPAGADFLDMARAAIMQDLARVKADIERDRHERFQEPGS